jgi:hypothetical protein
MLLLVVEHKSDGRWTSIWHKQLPFPFLHCNQLEHMASTGSRAFGTSAKATMEWVGATKADILTQNPGERGKQALKAIEKIEEAAEKKASRSFIP